MDGGGEVTASARYGRLFTEEDVDRLVAMAVYGVVHMAETINGAKAVELCELAVPLTFPADEPLFLLRASEGGTVEVLHDAIAGLISRPIRGVLEVPLTRAAAVFREWQAANPDRVKVPD